MTKYTLYIGLNDKDTKRQEVQTLEAFKVSANIFKALTGGATISEAQGIYTHDNGDIVIEKTLRCEVYGATLEAITQAADQLKNSTKPRINFNRDRRHQHQIHLTKSTPSRAAYPGTLK